ncbi:MAG: hypothetical protein ABI665_08950 [Vicinamibacterales bacterium]
MKGRTVQQMVKRIAVAAIILLIFGTVGRLVAKERDFIARFDGGIGVIPVSNGAGPLNADGTSPNVRLNVVRGVNPGAGPWRIGDLRADIDTSGRIKVRGRGLLLASGNSIGQTANQNVFATLICGATAPFVEYSTTFAVALATNGDFHIDDTLNPIPSECASPVLLIRNTGGVWFAAGIPKLGDD